MAKIFEGRKSKIFGVAAFFIVATIVVIAFAWLKPANAQTPVITQEELDDAISALTAEMNAQYQGMVEKYNSLQEDLSVLMLLLSEEKEAQVQPEKTVVSSPRSAEVVTTIRQVGGGEEVAKLHEWNAENKVSLLPIEDLGWEGIHRSEDGNPLYVVALSMDKGRINIKGGTAYDTDKGIVAVFITATPQNIEVYVDYNNASLDKADHRYNVWPEVYVVSSDLDLEETSKRLLAEWVEVESKDLGFYVRLDGTPSKMKFDEAVQFNEQNDPLFPDDLPQLPAGEKPFILTVSQVGAGGEIIDGWKIADTFVSLPKPDTRQWEGIMKNGDKPIFLVLISSDAGMLKFGDIEKEFKTGFVAAFITDTPNSIQVLTGHNEQTGHQNVWSEKFIIPSDENIDEILIEKLLAWKKADGKPMAFAILSDGTEYSK